MADVYRANLDLGKLRTHIWKSERIGCDDAALRQWLLRRGFWPEGERWLAEASDLAALPAGVVTDRGPPVVHPRWEGDPIYAAIAVEIEESWQDCELVAEALRDGRRFVLAEEY